MAKPLVLIGYSTCQDTRKAFQDAGCEAYTCDLRASDGPNHLQCDIWEALLAKPWSMAVLHPMCTYLTCAASWAYKDGPYHQKVGPNVLLGAARRAAREDALDNFRRLLELPFPVAIENPAISFVNKAIRRPSQVIHPYQFGDDASKATGFWLTGGLPQLEPTEYIQPRIVNGKKRWANQSPCGAPKLPPSPDRWLLRSKTYPGIARAIGAQWGAWLVERV